jgi:hypothetical protein
MTVRKLVYLDDDTAAAARAAAESEGVSLSDWLSQAARTATLEHGARVDPQLVAEHAARQRPLSPEAWRRADATAHQLGLDAYSAGV